MPASSTASVISCRINRARPHRARCAPPTRHARCAPRASSRFVTLTHVIASSRMTAPMTACSAGRMPRVISACKEVATNPLARLAHGTRANSGAGVSAIWLSSRLAWSRVTFGRSRAISRRWWPHSRLSGPNTVSYCSGAHSSAAGATTFSKAAGITPMTRKRHAVQRDLPTNDCPITGETRARVRRSESPRSDPFGRSSSRDEVAPDERRNAERAEEPAPTRCPESRSGSARPIMAGCHGLSACERLETAAAVSQLAIRAERDIARLAVGARVGDHHDALASGYSSGSTESGARH